MKELTIEKIVHGGFGLARTPEGIVFVHGALPGETAQCETIGTQGGIAHYQAKKILAASPDRVSPPCEYATVCGGCNWQYAKITAQTEFKRDIFLDALSRVGKLTIDIPIRLISHQSENYRQRAQIKIDQKNHVAGFFKESTNEVISIGRCPLLTDSINNLLANPASMLDAKVDAVKVLGGNNSRIASSPLLANTFSTTTIAVGSHTFSVRGDGFFQSNAFLASDLATFASEYIRGSKIVDLYSGVGFFPIASGKRFDSVAMVESAPFCKEMTLKNCADNKFPNATFYANDVESFLARNFSVLLNADTLIIDPPRTGLDKPVRKSIGASGIKRIISVSCDPATHARDIGYFVAYCGYSISAVALFDMYPHTHHSETVIILDK